ncbi:MAG TPA: alpha/beta fold hydrolase [Stellaceae bacterium]|nr:alpha/beta fold hydrolase [Stellaceae bacterium]
MAIDIQARHHRADNEARNDRWLDLPRQPLDLNGPVSRVYRRFDRESIDRPLFSVFLDVAERAPETVAVEDPTRRLTYGELRDGSCRLAQALTAMTPADRPIGVLLPNDAHYPIAVLACLAAGRPCVLLDRSYPAARNAAIIADAGLGALIVARGDEELAPKDVACITIEAAFATEYPAEPPAGIAWQAEGPAFIVYTSGSTGQPKGIALAQRTFIHRSAQLIDALHLNPDDNMMPLGSPCTVAGLLQMVEAFMAGATLIKLDVQQAGLTAVIETIAQKGATTLLATPALLRSLCRLDGAPEKLAGLRCVHAAGDVVLGVDVEAMRRALSPSCLFLVTYGATEAPAMCHWFVMSEAVEGARVPVGYPLPDYRYAMIGDDAGPAAADEPGELVISSIYAALGEWQGGRVVPGRFETDPSDPKSRILRTGDLVRRRADGLITVLGRKDRLVKIRGMRVEPYEIECALRRLPDVADAAIVVRRDGDNATLLAFVVLSPSAPGGALDDLRAELRRSLPSYMQPTRMHAVATLPLLPGHKIDVEQLLAVDDAGSGDAALRRKTADLTSANVATAWEQILDRASFEDDAPFDQAGGDSLSLLTFVCELERLCGRQLPLVHFELAMRPSEIAQTIGQFAGNTQSRVTPTTRPAAVVLLKPGSKSPAVFLTHGIGGHVYELAELAKHLDCDHPIYALQLPGLAEGEPVLDRVENMAGLFREAIRQTEPEGPYLLVGYSLGGLLAYETACQLQAVGHRTGLMLLDTHPHPRFWPLGTWLGYLAGRLRMQCGLLMRQRPGKLAQHAVTLTHSLSDHVRVRRGLNPKWREPTWLKDSAGLRRIRLGMIAAKANYRPPSYAGTIAFLQPETRQIGAPDNPLTAWRRHVDELHIVEVPGDHLSMVLRHAPATAAQLDAWIKHQSQT